MTDIYDLIIVGAGASGLIAAGKSGENGLKTLLLEKKSRPGIKLSITGKGRCNFTNSADIKEFVNCFRNGKFLYCAFKTFSNSDIVSFFENGGIPCKLERGGRYFPSSDKAEDIVNALVKYAKKHSLLRTSYEVKSVYKNKENLFVVNNSLYAYNLILACGGITYPATGSTGDGYAIAESFGHSIVSPLPALVPLNLNSDYLKDLKGLKLKNIKACVINEEKNISFAEEFGEAEFTSFGIDGPIILTLSSVISEKCKKENLILSLNMKPALNKKQLELRLLREIDKFGRCNFKDMLKEFLPLQMIRPFANYTGINMTKKCSQINKTEREKILNSMFDFRFKIKSTRDIREAIITRGGISTDEIEQKTMQSKLVPGLFFCGEIIDIDAPTGGFNLQAAFSTGYLAASSINIKKEK